MMLQLLHRKVTPDLWVRWTLVNHLFVFPSCCGLWCGCDYLLITSYKYNLMKKMTNFVCIVSHLVTIIGLGHNSEQSDPKHYSLYSSMHVARRKVRSHRSFQDSGSNETQSAMKKKENISQFNVYKWQCITMTSTMLQLYCYFCCILLVGYFHKGTFEGVRLWINSEFQYMEDTS